MLTMLRISLIWMRGLFGNGSLITVFLLTGRAREWPSGVCHQPRPLHPSGEGRRHHRLHGGRHQSFNNGAQKTLLVGEHLWYHQVHPLLVGTDVYWILVSIFWLISSSLIAPTSWRFNMMTLIILTWVGFFTLPLVYKNNQVYPWLVVQPRSSQQKSSLMVFLPAACLILSFIIEKSHFLPPGCCRWRSRAGQQPDLWHQGESDGSDPHEEQGRHEEGGVITNVISPHFLFAFSRDGLTQFLYVMISLKYEFRK